MDVRLIAWSICALCGADRAVVFVYEPATEALRELGAQGGVAFPVHASPLALRAAVTGVPAFAGEVREVDTPLLDFRPVACLPLLAGGRLAGIVYLDRTDADRARLREVAQLAAVAVDAVRRRSPAAGSDAGFARALHDGVLQTLCAVVLEAERGLDDSSSAGRLERILDLARAGTEELREALATLGGSPPERTGLELALDRLVADTRQRAGDLAIDVEIDAGLRDREDALTEALYRTCREGLANVVRHAKASHCHIRCGIDGEWAFATVEDDGVGTGGEAGPWHFGLMYLRGVIEDVGGSIEIRRREPTGTILVGRAPL